MGNSTDAEGSFRKLKMQKYPSHIPESQWLPSEFYATSKQNDEVLLLPNGDRRVRANSNDYKRNHQIYNIVRLKVQYSNHYLFGTGVIVHHSIAKSFVLTAAHNLVEANEYNPEKLQYHECAWMEINENTSDGYKRVKRYDCRKYAIHPKYIQFLKSNVKESATGYDIAIFEVFDPENKLRQIKPAKMRTFQSKTENSMKIKVIGYPGEEKLRGQLYGMRGDGNIQFVSSKVQYKKLIVYKNIDTTRGQSGCPIFKVPDESKEHDEKYDDNIYKSFDEIVGLHVVGSLKLKLNFGTMLNDEILQWIHESIYTPCVSSDKCAASVLLITSTKSKYAWRLNEIYKKCIKTKIMNVTRLYYDYVEDETVNKNDFLCYVTKMFTDAKRKRYLIFYCGESDEHGNWKINNNKADNVSLNDISLCARHKHKDSSVCIVADCNQSGNWVKLKQDKIIGENITCIQASSKENESCSAGAFTSKYAQCCFHYKYELDKNESKATLIPKAVGWGVGASVISGLGLLTVGTLYDSILKQPYHKATKYSQPTSNAKDKFHNVYSIGYASDGADILIFFYDSWYQMDVFMTFHEGGKIGTANSIGFF